MSCGEILSYWGSWASIVGLFLTFATLLIAKSVKDHIVARRFDKRSVQILGKMRDYERVGNAEKLKEEFGVFVSAMDIAFNCVTLHYSKLLSPLYEEAKLQSKSDQPKLQRFEGLLANYKMIHAEPK